jgi:hypothetical protein
MTDLRIKEVKVNLVERREWEAYDMAGELGETVFQAAGDTYSRMEGPVSIDQQVTDVLSFGGKKRFVDEDTVRAIYEAMNNGKLETFDMLIRDWFTYTWEDALTPTDDDIKLSGDEAVYRISQEWNSHLSDYDALLQITETLGPSPPEFLKKLLETSIDYERKFGWYDRYLVFAPERSLLVWSLLNDPIQPKGAGVLDWSPSLDISKKDIRNELKAFFQDIKETVIENVFSRLEKNRTDVNFENRTGFHRVWKNMLQSDPMRIKEAKKELKGFLKERAAEGETS